jgi:hypothetical protein
MLFEEFHRDLFASGADVWLQQPIDFLPPLAAVAGYADGSIAVWTKDQTPPVAAVRNPLRRVYATPGGWCEIGPDSTTLRYEAAAFHLAEPVPVLLDPAPFTVNVSVAQRSSDGLALDFSAADADAAKPLALRVGDGAYPVAPGSRHHVTFVSGSDWRTALVTADAGGWLRIALPHVRCRLLITGATSDDTGDTGDTVPAGHETVIDVTPTE